MSGLLFCTSEDFQIKKGSKGEILCHEIPGFSLILFYSTSCKFCIDLIPIFKCLPGSIGGCQFGMVNISKNKKIVSMSRETLTKIDYVPLILLYVNGCPYMRYDGPHAHEPIRNFVLDIAKMIKNKQFSTTTSKTKTKDEIKSVKNSLPAYSLGKPVSGQKKNVCYLEFDKAYNK